VNRVVIIDYGMGNIKSVQRGLEHVGANVDLSYEPEVIRRADRLILPGVGAFENGMSELKKKGLIDVLHEFVKTGRPLMGICLGMQMLFDKSEEHGEHDGLKIIPGSVIKIPLSDKKVQVRKIPHIGWSALHYPLNRTSWKGSLIENINEGGYFYFVHSFMAKPKDNSHLLAQCEYEDLSVTAAVRKDNVTGFQFHPEKSGPQGLSILKQFLKQ